MLIQHSRRVQVSLAKTISGALHRVTTRALESPTERILTLNCARPLNYSQLYTKSLINTQNHFHHVYLSSSWNLNSYYLSMRVNTASLRKWDLNISQSSSYDYGIPLWCASLLLSHLSRNGWGKSFTKLPLTRAHLCPEHLQNKPRKEL